MICLSLKNHNSYKIWKQMTRLLRHQGYPREEEQLNELDGADVDRPLGERKREEHISVSLGLLRLPSLPACYSRPFWREQS